MQEKILTGQCASPGEVTGDITYYKEDVVYSSLDIVILNQWVTKDIALLKNAGAILSAQGGITCHASIIAREFGIPCLVSVQGLEVLIEGDKVAIDAAAEEIKIIK